ncbi:MAG TPA: GntR family transcriptional regulator [Clostridiales bacterium]|nr:GntR family transcriptional regulator [Clostridiales bacterium]HBE12784.1 GntR family transcriptional regulator [Clostridiales bacterium]HCG35496.1 GntR family transcriptional regulator [Clostridiales bacterium]
MNPLSGSSTSLTDEVFKELEQAILDGSFQAGDSLIETKLSKQLGVSRTPIREALRQLEHEELVRTIPNKGAVVIGISIKDIEDMYTIRIAIEGLAAQWAAESATPDRIAQLREIVELQEFYSVKNEPVQIWQLDSRFHSLLYTICGSRILKHTLGTFHNYVQKGRELSISAEGRITALVAEHRAIYEAIVAHDSLKAKELTEQHIINAQKSVMNKLKG